ncbi:MAG: YncE family protein [Cytophagaceae bacterium]
MFKSFFLPLLFSLFFLSFQISAQNSKLEFIANLPAAIDESSGLAYTPKGLFTINDGKKGLIYKIDAATGELLQTLIISNVPVMDIEAMCFDGEFLYIGDFGNNTGERKDLKVVKIKLASIGGNAIEKVKGEVINFNYSEQVSFVSDKKSNQFDCESLIAFKDSLYIFTKRRNDHQTALYALPKQPGNYQARFISTFDVKGRITGAAISSDGKKLLLLGYQKKHHFPFIWKFEGFSGDNFLNGSSAYVQLTSVEVNWQTEGITFVDNNQLYISSESSKDLSGRLYKIAISDLFRK